MNIGLNYAFRKSVLSLTIHIVLEIWRSTIKN